MALSDVVGIRVKILDLLSFLTDAKVAEAAMRKLGASAEAAAAEGSAAAGGGLLGMTKMIGMISLAAGVAGVELVKMAAPFQANMELIHTQAGVAQGKIGDLSSRVLTLSGQLGTDPNSMAVSLYHVESAWESMGITSDKAMKIVEVATKTAKIGQADLVETTNALNAAIVSGIPGVEDMNGAAGMLLATIGSGDMHMSDLTAAFGTGQLATLKTYGWTLKDVGASLALFGDNNLRGANAMTQLRMAAQSMVKPVQGGEKALASIGLTQAKLMADMQKGGPLAVLKDLQQHMNDAGLKGVQVGAKLTDIYGKKAGTGISILVDQVDRLGSKYTALDKGAGGFADAWSKTTDNVTFKWQRLEQTLKAGAIRIGLVLLPIAGTVLDVLTTAFTILGFVVSVVMKVLSPFSGILLFLVKTIAAFAAVIGTYMGVAWLAQKATWAWGVATEFLATNFTRAMVVEKAKLVLDKAIIVVTKAGMVATALWTAAIKTWAFITSWAAIKAGVFRLASLAWAAAQGIATLATEGLTAAMVELDIAMDANPIGLIAGLIVVAVALIAGAIYLIWTHTKILQTAFSAIGKFFVWLWNDEIKPVWDAFATVVVWLWNTILRPTWDAIVAGWNALGAALSWVYDHSIGPMVSAIGAVFRWLYAYVVKPVIWLIVGAFKVLGFILSPLKLIGGAFEVLGAVISWVYHSIIKPIGAVLLLPFVIAFKLLEVVVGIFVIAFKIAIMAIAWVWNNILKPALMPVAILFMVVFKIIEVIVGIFIMAFKIQMFVLGAIFKAVGMLLKWVYDHTLKPVFEMIGAQFKLAVGVIQWVYDHTLRPVFDALGSFIKRYVAPAFRAGAKIISGIWKGMVDSFKAPIKVFVSFVNDGIIGPYDTVADVFGGPHVDKIKLPQGFRDGGLLQGGTPGVVDSIPAVVGGKTPIRVDHGEYLTPARQVARPGVLNALEALRTGDVRAAGQLLLASPAARQAVHATGSLQQVVEPLIRRAGKDAADWMHGLHPERGVVDLHNNILEQAAFAPVKRAWRGVAGAAKWVGSEVKHLFGFEQGGLVPGLADGGLVSGLSKSSPAPGYATGGVVSGLGFSKGGQVFGYATGGVVATAKSALVDQVAAVSQGKSISVVRPSAGRMPPAVKAPPYEDRHIVIEQHVHLDGKEIQRNQQHVRDSKAARR